MTAVASGFIFIDSLFVGFGLDNLFTTVHAVGADVVTQVQLTGGCVCRYGRRSQVLVRTVHTALGR